LIPKDCKRLAEVDFPIALVSKHAAREKSIRHGHPSTLHLWWARRPLASSRAVLLSLLWPDPCDPLCPDLFKARAREMLPRVQGRVGPTDAALRAALLKFIGDCANWDVAASAAYLDVSRALVTAAYPEEPPLIVDPFAGGGSIPLEALRVGAETFASDLNPVACLILKVMLEDIPRRGPDLADEIRRAGSEIKTLAEAQLVELYPPDHDGGRPIAYLWARTVRCETSGCGAEIPLVRSLWLSKKANRRRAIRLRVERPVGSTPRIEAEILTPTSPSQVAPGTITRANATCPACRTVMPAERVRQQLASQRGGADVVFDTYGRRSGGARLLAVALLRPGESGRQYRSPTTLDYDAVRLAQVRVRDAQDEWLRNGQQGLSPFPDEPLPPIGTLGFRVQRYGMSKWGDLFTARQKFALSRLAGEIRKREDGQKGVTEGLAAAFGRCADHWSSGAMWIQDLEAVAHTFGRQALPMVWDFVEACGFSEGGASWSGQIDWVARVVESFPAAKAGQLQQADAAEHPLPDETAQVWFTDPPYYDAVPYADLSDYFLVWLKRAMPGHPLLRDPFDPTNPLSPKRREAVEDESKQDNGRIKDRHWFEETMANAFREGRRVLRDEGIGSVVFAHKTTEGWEALLSGMIRGGWTISGSWPIATERPTRLRSLQSAALATSVHLICRPRPFDAPVADWGDVLRALPVRVSEWMQRLQGESIRGADLVFACIGPALEVFSRYSSVETAEGRIVTLPEYLEKVWEVVGRSALNQILGTGEHGAGAIEEDARLTALFLWTLQSTNGGAGSAQTQVALAEDGSEGPDEQSEGDDGTEEATAPSIKTKGYTLVYDVVRRFAQPLGIRLDMWEDRVIETRRGTVRLLALDERSVALLGAAGSRTLVSQPSPKPSPQLSLFGTDTEDLVPPSPAAHVSDGRRPAAGRRDLTTLDRVHLAMLLQGGGQAAALRNMLAAEQDRGPEFLRLANALSALYPRESEEKRLLDAMLLAVPR
jgi:adenine-specific DNA methylase